MDRGPDKPELKIEDYKNRLLVKWLIKLMG